MISVHGAVKDVVSLSVLVMLVHHPSTVSTLVCSAFVWPGLPPSTKNILLLNIRARAIAAIVKIGAKIIPNTSLRERRSFMLFHQTFPPMFGIFDIPIVSSKTTRRGENIIITQR